jgi:hypothetical protein
VGVLNTLASTTARITQDLSVSMTARTLLRHPNGRSDRVRRRLARGNVARQVVAGCVALVATGFLVAVPIGPAEASPGVPTPSSTAVLTGPPHSASEAAIAVDPDDDDHLAAAENMYTPQPRVKVVESHDGGATWTAPLDVTPPGFSKSFDPSVVFVGGALEVVAGASGTGAQYCQPGSAIAVMRVHPDRTFTTRFAEPPQGPNHYVDRPTAAVDSASGRLYVSWTASSGSGAECLGTPVSSQIMLTQAVANAAFPPATTVATTGTAAPFGAAIAVDGDGTLWAAVGGHDPGRRSQLAVVSSTDHGTTFGRPTVLAEGPPTAKRLPGLAGLNAPIPSIAVGAGERVLVAWPIATSTGATVGVFLRSDAAWQPLAPFTPDGTPFLAAAGLTRSGVPVVLSAAVMGSVVTFESQSFAGSWTPPAPLANSPAGDYMEIGEGLGLATIGDEVVTAVPLDGPLGSSLLVTRQRIAPPAPKPAPTTATTSTEPRATTPSTTVLAAPRRRPAGPEQRASSERSGRVWLYALPVVGVGAAVLWAARWKRRP